MSIRLSLENVSFQYQGIGASDAAVLHDISFTLKDPVCTAIVGPSGSGKTTLIQHFTGLLKPGRGRVLVDGVDIWSKKYSFTRLRKRIGLVFQFPEVQLFEETVGRDVAFGPQNLQLSAAEIDERVQRALTLVGLDSQTIFDRSPFRLSEGEKRKVAIAGILAMHPEMIVFDEPTAGMDPVGVQNMVALLYSLLDQGTMPVFITHNMDFVAEAAQRVIVLLNGGVLFDGTPARLFDSPSILAQAGLEMPEFVKAFQPFRERLPAFYRTAVSFRQLEHMLQERPLNGFHV